jgi:hypothetical protein
MPSTNIFEYSFSDVGARVLDINISTYSEFASSKLLEEVNKILSSAKEIEIHANVNSTGLDVAGRGPGIMIHERKQYYHLRVSVATSNRATLRQSIEKLIVNDKLFQAKK